MKRVRISTTVNAHLLTEARRLHPGRDSQLLDAALDALRERIEGERERAALDDLPYVVDDELVIPEPEIDWDRELPYDGDVPAEVLELAERRRRGSE